jgi:hypothetical protein
LQGFGFRSKAVLGFGEFQRLGRGAGLEGFKGCNGLEDAETLVRMAADVVVDAQLLLDEAARLELLCAGEASPIDEKPLATDGTAHVAADVGKLTDDFVHEHLLLRAPKGGN